MTDEKDNPLLTKVKPYLAEIIDHYHDQIVEAGSDALEDLKSQIAAEAENRITEIIPMNPFAQAALHKLLPKAVDTMVENM